MAQIPTGLNNLTPSPQIKSDLSGVFGVRVRHAMVDDKTENQAFKDFGEWSSIGCIFFDTLNNPNPNPQFSTDNFARPLFPNNSNIPLKNEIVYWSGDSLTYPVRLMND